MLLVYGEWNPLECLVAFLEGEIDDIVFLIDFYKKFYFDLGVNILSSSLSFDQKLLCSLVFG